MATSSPDALPRDLTSDLVRECLGFHVPERSRSLDALTRIRASLRSCAADDARDDGGEFLSKKQSLRRRRGWRAFLEGRSPPGIDEFGGAENNDGSAPGDDVVLRDGLVRCLVEGCGGVPPAGDGGEVGNIDGEEQSEGCLDLDATESSFLCLAYLVRLRCDDVAEGPEFETTAPVFGYEFVTAVAPRVVEALRSSNPRAPRAACRLLDALLRPDRPRNEACPDAVRDAILVPACVASESPIGASKGSFGSVACVAQVLSSSIVVAVEMSVPDTGSMEEEELSMRRETAALNRLQDMRDVVMHVGLACSRGLGWEVDDTEARRCVGAILGSLQEIHDVAAFAVESQLETLLGDEGAMPILARLSGARLGGGVVDKIAGATAPAAAAGCRRIDDLYDDDISEDGKEAKFEEATTLAPLYANIPKPPAFLTTYKNLDSMLVSITEKLNTTDASLWDERLDALIDLECILAGGVARISREARDLFIEKLRRMPIQEQFQDLRSQITQQVCRVIVATSYEYRDHVSNDAQLNQALSHLVECLVFPSILNLCKSGTRLMAAQGMNCLMNLFAVCGSIGYSRTIPRFCEEVLGDGKVHKNRKRGSVMALTVALRVWEDRANSGGKSCFVKHLDPLVKATKEAAINRDPAVREEGRKLYWAMCACCNETSRAVEAMFHESSREMKNLKKERDAIDSEWKEGGAMSALVKTGVLGPKDPKLKKQKSSHVPPPTRSSIKRPAGSFRSKYGTPFKSHRTSTPMKSTSSGEAGVVGASFTSKKIRPPSKLSTPSTLKTSSAVRNSVDRRGGSDVVRSSSKIPRSRLPSTTSSTRHNKPEDYVAPSRSALKGRNSGIPNSSSSAAATPFMKTPTKNFAVGFQSPEVVMGTPVVNMLARASPLSAEKVRNTGDVLGTIISMLNDTHSPHEQSLGIKALALFATEEPRHHSWEEKFPLVLGCLLEQIKNMPTAVFEEPVDFIRSPSKKSLSSCHQMQHLFLQGVRSLLQPVSFYVKSEQVKDIVRCMLECTKDAPFEIVHTAERALHNLVTNTEPETCFEHLLPFTFVEIDLNDRSNPPALLSTLRTVRYLVDRISIDSLKGALPSLLPLFHKALCHKSVDMRKATVFILVEMHFVLGEDELTLMDNFTDCQRRLVDVYIDKHVKTSRKAKR